MARARNRNARTESADAHVVTLDAALRIGSVAALYAQLRDAIEGAAQVILDAARVESTDTASLQLLYAFVREGRERGIEVNWRAPAKPLCRDARLLGLSVEMGLSGH